MNVRETRQGAVTVLRPDGPVTGADAGELRSAIQRALARSLGRMVLDVSETPFVDSAGLETLVEAAEQLGAAGQAMRLCGATATLREILDVTETAPLFEFFADAGDATRSFL
ncbi:MAG: STAS domain-containing protein [Phycisphaerae bacterium]|nr:STAS domain-containing protein [Phycisphaerae bacterium]